MVRELRERFGDDLRYVFRHLPLTDVHAHAELAARAAEAAGAQGRFWELHDLLFAHQDELELEDLLGYAGELGLDVEQFARDLEDERLAARVRADVEGAEASGAGGTPTFFVGDRRHVGAYDAETLMAELTAGAPLQGGVSLAHELAVVLVVEQLLGVLDRDPAPLVDLVARGQPVVGEHGHRPPADRLRAALAVDVVL